MWLPRLQQQQQQQHPIYSGPRLRRDGKDPLDPIEWVRRDEKIRTGCTPRGELNSQQGDHAPMVQKRSGRRMPVARPQCNGLPQVDPASTTTSQQQQQQLTLYPWT